MNNSKQPAFPHQRDTEGFKETDGGLTKREYFAAMAMQGICANPTAQIKPHGRDIAVIAIECADELLKRLENEG